MSALAYDIARCAGKGKPACVDCRRRELGRGDWRAYLSGRVSDDGLTCDDKISPEPPKAAR